LSVLVASVEGYARRLDAVLGEVVGGLAATYLHGSAALGGFVPGRSDVDMLVICEDRPIIASDWTRPGRRCDQRLASLRVAAWS
jgi:predicted nucleotidyltransferase